MGNPIKDLTGQRFGRLVVEAFARITRSKSVWIVVCDCGTRRTAFGSELTRESMPLRSCGCLGKENKNAFIASLNERKRRDEVRREMKAAEYLTGSYLLI